MTPHLPRLRPSVLDALLRSAQSVVGVLVGIVFGGVIVLSAAALLVARMP